MPTPRARRATARAAARVAAGAAASAALFAVVAPTALRAQQPARDAAAAAVGTIRGRVTDAETGRPVAEAQIAVVGTTIGALTNADGSFVLARVPTGARTVRVRRIGYQAIERTVQVAATGEARLEIAVQPAASRLDQVVVTALGRTTEARAIGTAQQSVAGTELAQTQRENFVNALQGRIAGVNVTSTSGVPGASSSITIRGISSISGSNQPLFIVDGVPVDNKTLSTGGFASDAPGSAVAFSNRGVDFTNRIADINPEDIESVTVLKGAEAAALYGIDAGNGAIVITTKRGSAGTAGFQYSNNFRFDGLRDAPEVQRVYSPSDVNATAGTFRYFGAPYADTTRFFDNINGFFRTGRSQQHNLTFNGGAPDNRVNYRLGTGLTQQEGVIPNASLRRINLTGSSQGQVTRWLRTDLSMQFVNTDNDQPFRGAGGPLLGLLVWPSTDNAADWLTPAGTRRRLTTLTAQQEVDNPYFSVNRNRTTTQTNRFIANLGLIVTPFSWGSLTTRLNADGYTTQAQIVRSPESALAIAQNGILDETNDINRNVNALTTFEVQPQKLWGGLSLSGFVGNQITDERQNIDALAGRDFLDPTFVSINNTNLRSNRTTLVRRRLIGLYGQAQFDYNRYLFVTLIGRNDWTSTIPQTANSFFYPALNASFVYSDAFPSLRKYVTGKLRGGIAEAGRDARPYADRPALEFKTTSFGGYGYGFTGPNPNLKPEFTRSYEFGGDFNFFQERLGLDVTYYRKQTRDQIVNDIRGSYGTGFILFNLNGGVTRNTGLEVSLRGTPVQKRDFSWNFIANFDRSRGRVLALPAALPESYVSETQLFGNVRNGTAPGLSTMSLTGWFFLRNKDCQLLIDPTSGLPLRASAYVATTCPGQQPYDRQPNFTVGLNNSFRYKRAQLSFLLDIRRGGDVLNATQHYLTTRGLAMNTLDRDRPRVIQGVLRDGRENSANPTANTIVVVPSAQTGYYTNMSEELFIERNINWLRLRDLRLSLSLPARYGRNATVFVAGTDLFLITNYSGLDPVTNGNTAAVGGSGAAGIDFGAFPLPRGLQFGITTGF